MVSTSEVDFENDPSDSVKLPDESKMLEIVVRRARPERQKWRNKMEFLLAVIGFAVDLGTIWRFPFICYENGGGAFLIPWFVMFLFGGLPLFYMELALGQFHKCGCLTLWKKICPALKGIGYAICLLDVYMGMYYNTVVAWAVYYLYVSVFACFTSDHTLPWTSCDNEWNTPHCAPVTNLTAHLINGTTSPANEFFIRMVLERHLSDGMNDIGWIKWSLALCLLAVFLLVYFSLWKGVQSAGQAVWITALAPYFVLLILLIRGVSLPGASDGIRYYLTPKWRKLLSSKVWIDAAAQVFFSLGPGFGTLLALSSYNKFNNNFYRDAVVTGAVNCFTCLLAGFVVFCILGYMANVQNKTIQEVGLDGPGLVFIVYPEAIGAFSTHSSLFFAIIFFLLLILLGLDSTFGGLEAMVTALCDDYPNVLGPRRKTFVAALLVFIYMAALPTTTYGGYYLVTFLNVFGPCLAILFVVFVEAVGVCWVYGVSRFCDDVQLMLGYKPGLFWRICWTYISPIFLLVIFACSVFNYRDQITTPDYEYPEWSIIFGWMITLSSILCIPVYIVINWYKTSAPTFGQRIKRMFSPPSDFEGETMELSDAKFSTILASNDPTSTPPKLCPREPSAV